LPSAFWQCQRSSHQAFCCHLGPHEEEVGKESNTNRQLAEDDDDPIAQRKKRSGHPSKLSVAIFDLMKKKLEKIPTVTESQMKMRMKIDKDGRTAHY
jgi:hypothetical protein